MAGLSAADHLVRNGCTDVIVLEAQNRSDGPLLMKTSIFCLCGFVVEKNNIVTLNNAG